MQSSAVEVQGASSITTHDLLKHFLGQHSRLGAVTDAGIALGTPLVSFAAQAGD